MQDALFFKTNGDNSVVQFERIAEVVDVEQLGRQRIATVMSLTFLFDDVYSHCPIVLPIGNSENVAKYVPVIHWCDAQPERRDFASSI